MADKLPTRIRLVLLRESLTLGGAELTSVAPIVGAGVTPNQATISPVCIDAEGCPRQVEKGQKSEGLLFSRPHQKAQVAAYVPWSGIKSVMYGE